MDSPSTTLCASWDISSILVGGSWNVFLDCDWHWGTLGHWASDITGALGSGCQEYPNGPTQESFLIQNPFSGGIAFLKARESQHRHCMTDDRWHDGQSWGSPSSFVHGIQTVESSRTQFAPKDLPGCADQVIFV